jgi:hypothetical protein
MAWILIFVIVGYAPFWFVPLHPAGVNGNQQIIFLMQPKGLWYLIT